MFYGKLLQVKHSQHVTTTDPRRGIHRDWYSYFRVLMGHYLSFGSYKVSTVQKRVTFTEHRTNGKQLEWLLCISFFLPCIYKLLFVASSWEDLWVYRLRLEREVIITVPFGGLWETHLGPLHENLHHWFVINWMTNNKIRQTLLGNTAHMLLLITVLISFSKPQWG